MMKNTVYMRLLKRIIAASLSAAMLCTLFSSCGGSRPIDDKPTSSQAAMGAYVETDITPPDAGGTPVGIWTNDEGIYYCDNIITDSGYMQYRLFHSLDMGTTWKEQDMSWQNNLGAGINRLTMTKQGNLLVVTYGEKGLGLWLVKKDGSLSEINLPQLKEVVGEGQASYCSHIEALSEDTFFIEYTVFTLPADSANAESSEAPSDTESADETTESVVTAFSISSSDDNDDRKDYAGIFKTNGDVIKQFDNLKDIQSVASNGEVLLSIDYLGNLFTAQASTGNLISGYPNQVGNGREYYVTIAVDKDANLYVATNKAIQRTVPEGSLEETILEGSMFSFGSPNNHVQQMRFAPNGDILLSLLTPSGGKLYRYHFDETVPALPDRELTVWSLKEVPSVRAAITVFQKKNPDIRINYTVALPDEETAISTDDVIRLLNTELLAGKGPDVLIMDGLDYQNYQQKGLLRDISKQINLSDLYQNMVKPFESADGLFVLPTRFSVPVLFGDKAKLDAVKSMKDLFAAAEKGPQLTPIMMDDENYTVPLPPGQRAVISFGGMSSAFHFIYGIYANDIISKNGGLNKEALTELLREMKIVSDKCGFAGDPSSDSHIMGFGMSSADGSMVGMGIDKGVVDYTVGHTDFGGTSLSSPVLFIFVEMSGVVPKDYILIPGASGKLYEPLVMAAVNANTQMQEESVDFVNSLLSEDVQGYDVEDGLPMSQTGMEQLIEKLNKDIKEMQLTPLDSSFENIIKQLSVPVTVDKAVSDIIFSEAERYCRSQATLDEAIQAIESKTEMYFAERQ